MKSAEIARMLPWIFQRTLRNGSLLETFLSVMEDQHARSEDVLAAVDRYFDPRRAPDEFVPFLATWLDLERVLVRSASGYYTPEGREEPLQSGVGHLRELVAEGAFLARWRGTGRGIVRFLELATGLRGFTVDEDVPGRPFHVVFTMPKEAEPYQDMVRKIIEQEKPAYVDYELAAGG
jgi:phage tail-like protein